MRTRSLLTAFLAALGLALAGAAPARETRAHAHARDLGTPTFFVVGRGWGHGIGLSQYGAYGYAQHGYRAERIVTHYYAGTTIGQAPVSRVRVLLRDQVRNVQIASKRPFAVKDGDGNTHSLDAGNYRVGQKFKVREEDGTVHAIPYPLLFIPGAQALALEGAGYRGSLQVTKRGSGVRVINSVGLEPYLWGVVPSEMPHSWAAEALKAQAIVARSYAIAHLRRGSAYDLLPDTRSQVYGGIRAEEPPSNAAVNATAGEVVLYRGKIADTFFFSTSGGRTAAVQDVWTSSSPIPYLKSVTDPYDSISPYHTWGPFRYSAAGLARRLHVPGALVDLDVDAARSGRVRDVIATGSRGQVTLDGWDVRDALGLRSTWFRIGSLSLARPTAAVVYGTRGTLRGAVRGVGVATLQQRPYGGTWKPVGRVRAASDGTVARAVAPTISTWYRLYAAGIMSGTVRMGVAPAIRLFAAGDASGFYGRVRPLLAGRVQIQRQVGGSWRSVASVAVAADGRFVWQAYPAAGTYRARFDPGGGYVAGVSPILRVVQ